MKAARLAALLVVPLAFAACGDATAKGSKRLELEAPKWSFRYLPVAVVAHPKGVLEGKQASLTVAVGSNVAGRWQMPGEATRIWIPGGFFETGPNLVSIKTGSERSEATVVVVAIGWLLVPLVLVAAIAFELWRRRRAGARRAA